MENFILEAFQKKFGKEIFNNITNSIKNELQNNGYSNTITNNAYISYLLEIAFLENCDVENTKIPIIIKRMGNNYIPPLEPTEIKRIHSSTINSIKNLLLFWFNFKFLNYQSFIIYSLYF